MSKALSVPAPPLAPAARAEMPLPPLSLQLAGGWMVAGLFSALTDLLPGRMHPQGGLDGLVAPAVDFGRHLFFGLASVALVWVFRRWLPRQLGWLAFVLLSLGIGALVLPTDLDGLAERLSEGAGVGADWVLAALVLVIGGALPAIAWLAQPRSWRWRWLGWGIRAACALVALCALYLNISISPGGNPSAHLYLSWLTALLAGHALPRLELSSSTLLRRRWWPAVAAALLGSCWAMFGPHANSVMIRLARRPSSLHLLAVLHSDGGVDNVQATLAARSGPFFTAREQLPPTPPSSLRPPAQRPVVVLFSMDSLRADLLRRPEHARYLPNLLELTRLGADFSNARAPGSMTKTTLSSISSGKYFSQQYWSGGKNRWPKKDRSIHLASVLSAAGVYTAAFPATDWLMNGSGILRGFERNELQGAKLPGHDRWIDGPALTAQVIEVLESVGERPAFLWVHYLDSHEPYFRSGKGGTAFDRYLRSLRGVDGYLGEVRAAIARLGLSERALLLVMSDHGEAFGEHDSRFHGSTLYDELLRVPLVATGAGVVPRRIEVAVSLIDLGPTILDWFGLETPSSFMGESLLPLLLGKSGSFERPIVAETGLKQAMLFDDGYKVIRDLRRKTLELYDLKQDPGELRNLSDQADPDHEEHFLLLRSFFQVHTYRQDGYRVPYVK